MICHVCSQDKPKARFDLELTSKTYGICKGCRQQASRLRANPLEGPRHTDQYRTCYICEQRKPIQIVDGRTGPKSGFTYRASNGSWYSACKACNKGVFGARSKAKKAQQTNKGSK